MHQNLLSNNNDAQSTTKYGFLLQPNAQIVALHANCTRTTLKVPPEYLITLARAGSFVEQMKITSVPGGNKVVLSKSIREYATENVLSQSVQWVGNNNTGATENTYKLQCAIFWWLTK